LQPRRATLQIVRGVRRAERSRNAAPPEPVGGEETRSGSPPPPEEEAGPAPYSCAPASGAPSRR
jgi:hypothetical protein